MIRRDRRRILRPLALRFAAAALLLASQSGCLLTGHLWKWADGSQRACVLGFAATSEDAPGILFSANEYDGYRQKTHSRYVIVPKDWQSRSFVPDLFDPSLLSLDAAAVTCSPTPQKRSSILNQEGSVRMPLAELKSRDPPAPLSSRVTRDLDSFRVAFRSSSGEVVAPEFYGFHPEMSRWILLARTEPFPPPKNPRGRRAVAAILTPFTAAADAVLVCAAFWLYLKCECCSDDP